MQKYPYYTVNRLDGGILVKLSRNRKYEKFDDAVLFMNKIRNNHKDDESQYVILKYIAEYQSRICMISQGSTLTWID